VRALSSALDLAGATRDAFVGNARRPADSTDELTAVPLPMPRGGPRDFDRISPEGHRPHITSFVRRRRRLATRLEYSTTAGD
jgi:hypothetical protein